MCFTVILFGHSVKQCETKALRCDIQTFAGRLLAVYTMVQKRPPILITVTLPPLDQFCKFLADTDTGKFTTILYV